MKINLIEKIINLMNSKIITVKRPKLKNSNFSKVNLIIKKIMKLKKIMISENLNFTKKKRITKFKLFLKSIKNLKVVIMVMILQTRNQSRRCYKDFFSPD